MKILDEHHRIVRRHLRTHGGREEGTQGDSFFATFTSPTACVGAALEMQLELAEYTWPGDEHPRVRMGIHSGEVTEAPTGLVGYEVHRAARIAAVGYGGQVLLSSASAGLVEDSLPADVSLRSLGSHRLKDLGRPEALFQLLAPGLTSEFAPLRSLDNPELPNNLPASLNPFIGRVAELAEVQDLVNESRLITLTGAGGSGKTRLALQVAAEMLDGSGEGVWFVELAPINDPEMVATAIVESLRLRIDNELSPLEALVHILRDQNVLIVLDNCEHLIESVVDVVDRIGRHCTRVTIMATSREPLGVRGEEVYRVRSLTLPAVDAETVQDLVGADAVDLFVARAHSLNRTFSLDDDNAGLVAAVCRRLDGIPLAIELAAARLSTMSLTDIYERLDQRFRLLTGGSRNALPRQQTLGAMVAWSYDLLRESEREVLRRLSVFVNGFQLDGAEAVGATGSVDAFDVADILGSLVNKSLVTAEHGSTTVRYRILETIRQYATDQLLQIDGEQTTQEARRRHAEYHLALCEEAAPSLWNGPRQVEWMHRMSLEWDNLWAALAYFANDSGGAAQVMRLCVATQEFLVMKTHREPIPLLEAALASGGEVPASLRGWSMAVAANLRFTETWDKDDIEGRIHRALQSCEEIESVAREADDNRLLCWSLGVQAFLEGFRNNNDVAMVHARSALEVAREGSDENFLGWAIFTVAVTLPEVEQPQLLGEAIELFRRNGSHRRLAGALQMMAIAISFTTDSPEESRRLGEESLLIAEEIGDDESLDQTIANLAIWTFTVGDVETAKRYGRRSLLLSRRQGRSPLQTSGCIYVLALCATRDGDFPKGAQLIAVFDRLIEDVPVHYWRWAPQEEIDRRDNTVRLQQELGEAEFERQKSIGLKLSFEQVVSLALERTDALL